MQGRNDWKKYETARKLKRFVDKIRTDYTKDLKSKLVRLQPAGGGCSECGTE